MEYKSPKARKKPFSPFVARLLREKLMAFSLRHLTSPPDAKSRRIATAALPQKRGLPGCVSLAPPTGASHHPTEPLSLPGPAGAAAAQRRPPARTAASLGPPEPLCHRLLRLPPFGQGPSAFPRSKRDRRGNSGWER